MKKVLLTLMCLAAMMAASTGLKAQEVTITLSPYWNWISYPNAVPMELNEALGDFVPAEGDIIKSRDAFVVYQNGVWSGVLTHFMPGKGYMYRSARTETVSFVFAQPSSSVVATATPTDITATSAEVGGMVILPEGSHVFLRGVCWGTEPNPDIDGNHTSNNPDIGSFTTTLTKLSSNTTYYLRAYAVTDYGLAYGEEQSFTTLEGGGGNVPEGAIDGLFTVNSDGDQVYFSQGNLQYNAVDNLWRFAEKQYDYIGDANSNISQFYSGWIDLFGWGTSGYNHGANCYQPWGKSSNYEDYYAYGSWNKKLSDQNGQADWGYNAISNGGNQEHCWRALSQSEWNYVLFVRNTISDIRFAKATIREPIIDTISNDTVFNDVHGVVLLPDDWNESAYAWNDANEGGAPYETNMIMATTWEALEALGAVFLPAAGHRNGFSNVLYPNSYGFYWSSMYGNSQYAYSLDFSVSWIDSEGGFYRFFGRSVRLVRNAE